MRKQRGKQLPQPAKFSVGVTNDQSSDCIFLTVGIPKLIDLPYVGPTSIETIGLATATCAVPWLLWLGRYAVRKLRQCKREEKDERNQPEPLVRPESPVKAKKWETSKSVKLNNFMNEVEKQREQLRKVDDPDTVEKRMKKREMVKKEQNTKPKGPLGLSAELLQNSRRSLNQAPDASLASYLDNGNNKERSLDDDLSELEGYLEEDIKIHNQFVNEESEKDERKVDAASQNNCIIS